ncbi:zinc-binding dehydrogenase, partial [Klebsiella pneumoniae]|uniref:zinc-binding dehydrogenase n=1 Tax=Klebsiella pneumoniae TaxID=573 RepID=UPI003EF1C81E
QNDVTLKMPAFEWVHVQLHQQKGMISLSPPTICNSAVIDRVFEFEHAVEAWRYFESQQHTGKVVITMN